MKEKMLQKKIFFPQEAVCFLQTLSAVEEDYRGHQSNLGQEHVYTSLPIASPGIKSHLVDGLDG